MKIDLVDLFAKGLIGGMILLMILMILVAIKLVWFLWMLPLLQ